MTEKLPTEITGQISDPGSWSGKTWQEHSVPTAEKTSDACLKKQQKSPAVTPLYLDLRGKADGQDPAVSWETGGALLGDYMTHSFGECPSEERESRLSQILEENVLPKYSLSARACQGILDRAARNQKVLPATLRYALEFRLKNPPSET